MPAQVCPSSDKLIDMDGFYLSPFAVMFLSETGNIFRHGDKMMELIEVPQEEVDLSGLEAIYPVRREDLSDALDKGVFISLRRWSGYDPLPESAFSFIESMTYPGRLIIAGQDMSGSMVAFYAITGRSSSSQARKLRNIANMMITVGVTDPKQLEKGDPALLIYNAMALESGHLVISNGAQTDPLRAIVRAYVSLGMNPDEISKVFRIFREGGPFYMATKDDRLIDLTLYEPDDPNWTPRISAILGGNSFVMDSVSRGDDNEPKEIRYIPLYVKGIGRMISTYTGKNVDPLPSFCDRPLDLELPWESLSDATNALYAALGPKEGQDDFRVSVAGVRFIPGAGEFQEVCIINRHK